MQTILGAGGAIGVELAKALSTYTNKIRLVSRNPQKVNLTDELVSADLTIRDEVFRVIEGSEIAYVVVGFPYFTKVWKELWPVFIKNVIDACLKFNVKLVFFDNVYAIGGDNVKHITESSPVSASSKKGETRAEVDRLILDAIDKKGLKAIIARSADFFSDLGRTSIIMNLIYNNLEKGKKAQWFCNPKVIHSCGYKPDMAKGFAMLGNTEDAYNQIWNLPTSDEKITGEQWIQLFAKEMKVDNSFTTLPAWGIKILGLFIPILRETHEMLYQYDRDYFFDSSKFNKHFNFTPTTNEIAVKQVVESLRGNK